MKKMGDVLLTIAIIAIGLDALSNAFLMVFYPKWEKIKQKEIEEIREQNEELRQFVKELLEDDTK